MTGKGCSTKFPFHRALALLLVFCALASWVVPPQVSAADRSRFRKAKRWFRIANRHARRGRYKRAIGYYTRIIKILNGDTKTDARARWGAGYRIAVLQIRRREYRKARVVLETLWSTAPSPASRYHRQLEARFRSLRGKLVAELRIRLTPADATLKLLDSRGLRLRPRRQQVRGRDRYLWFDAPAGTYTLISSKLGYATQQQTIAMEPIRSKLLAITLGQQSPMEAARGFCKQALQSYRSGSYEASLRDFQRCSANATRSRDPSSKALRWRADLGVGRSLVRLRRIAEARSLYGKMLSRPRGQSQEFAHYLCQLKRREGVPLPAGMSPSRCQTTARATPRPSPAGGRTSSPSGLAVTMWLLAAVGLGASAPIYFLAAEPPLKLRDSKPPLPESQRVQLHDEYTTYYALTWVALGVGVAAATFGFYWYFSRDFNRQRSPRAGLSPGPTPRRMLGSFR